MPSFLKGPIFDRVPDQQGDRCPVCEDQRALVCQCPKAHRQCVNEHIWHYRVIKDWDGKFRYQLVIDAFE